MTLFTIPPLGSWLAPTRHLAFVSSAWRLGPRWRWQVAL